MLSGVYTIPIKPAIQLAITQENSMRYRVQHQSGNGPYAMYKIVMESYTIHENLTIDAAKQLCRCLNDR